MYHPPSEFYWWLKELSTTALLAENSVSSVKRVAIETPLPALAQRPRISMFVQLMGR
jgi:hypothetical protein